MSRFTRAAQPALRCPVCCTLQARLCCGADWLCGLQDKVNMILGLLNSGGRTTSAGFRGKLESLIRAATGGESAVQPVESAGAASLAWAAG